MNNPAAYLTILAAVFAAIVGAGALILRWATRVAASFARAQQTIADIQQPREEEQS
ncbi:hypothetical protein [Streptomyces sp. NPDC093223]|uniref:hypothetical protein n=1 Tax=Streptomyces sp. NPDC093223 TaxID=3366033 RepID=UPI0037FFB97E